MLVILGFHKEGISSKIICSSHTGLWKFANPVLGRKNLKNIVLKRRQIITRLRRRIINLRGTPTFLGPALILWVDFKLLQFLCNTHLYTFLGNTSCIQKLWPKQSDWSNIFQKFAICFMKADSEIWEYSRSKWDLDEHKFRLQKIHAFVRVTKGTYNYVSCWQSK